MGVTKVPESPTNPTPQRKESVLKCPSWARYKVLAYLVTREELAKVGQPITDRYLKDEQGVQILDSDEIYAERCRALALVALDHTAGIVTQPYSTGCDEGRRDYLLAFCSSIPLPDESGFHLLEVRPDQKLDKIRKFGKLLGKDELPKWNIPDEAIPLEIRLDWMRDLNKSRNEEQAGNDS